MSAIEGGSHGMAVQILLGLRVLGVCSCGGSEDEAAVVCCEVVLVVDCVGVGV